MSTPTTLPDLQQKIEDLETGINTRLVERTAVTRSAVTALVGRVHHFQLGSPGIAKSLLVRTLVAHIDGLQDGDYFERLLTKFSTPPELFGPPSLTALKEDTYRFNTKGKLPEAKFAFVDEIFKANSAILNAMLTIMNERLFFNDELITVPLTTLYCASNELPQGEELEALYDRIHLKHVLKPISETGNFIKMLKSQNAGPIVPVISYEEISQAQDEASKVEVPDEVLDALNTLRVNLHKEGIDPTDRKFAESIKVIRATAWMNGRTVADIDDMRTLAHMMWETPDHIPLVQREVYQLANPLDKEAMDLLESVEKLTIEVDRIVDDSDNRQARNKQGIEAHAKLERAMNDLTSIKKRASGSGRKSEVIAEVEEKLLATTRKLLVNVFHIEQP